MAAFSSSVSSVHGDSSFWISCSFSLLGFLFSFREHRIQENDHPVRGKGSETGKGASFIYSHAGYHRFQFRDGSGTCQSVFEQSGNYRIVFTQGYGKAGSSQKEGIFAKSGCTIDGGGMFFFLFRRAALISASWLRLLCFNRRILCG